MELELYYLMYILNLRIMVGMIRKGADELQDYNKLEWWIDVWWRAIDSKCCIHFFCVSQLSCVHYCFQHSWWRVVSYWYAAESCSLPVVLVLMTALNAGSVFFYFNLEAQSVFTNKPLDHFNSLCADLFIVFLESFGFYWSLVWQELY